MCDILNFVVLVRTIKGSRTTSRRDFKPKGLQAEIKTLQAPQNAFYHLQNVAFLKLWQVKSIISVIHDNAPLVIRIR